MNNTMNTQEAIKITQDELESYEKMLESGHPEVWQIKKHIETDIYLLGYGNMLKEKIIKEVWDYISTGTIDDLQAMGGLAFTITILKSEAYERRKKTLSMQEAMRTRTYIDIKNEKKMTDKMADSIAKDEARTRYDYTDHEVDYRFYSDMLARLTERKIEVQSINKQQKYVDDGF